MNKNDFVNSLKPHHKNNWRKIVQALREYVSTYDHSRFSLSEAWDDICVGSIACKIDIVNLDEDDYNTFKIIIEDEDLFGKDAARMVFDFDSKFAEHIGENLDDVEDADGDLVADLLESWLELDGEIVGDSKELYVTIHWKGGRKDNFPSREAILQYLALNPTRKHTVMKYTVTSKVPRIEYDELTKECEI